MALTISVSENATLSESLTVYPIVLHPTIFDSITLSESITIPPVVLRANAFDSIVLIDTVETRANKLLVTINDSIVLSDIAVIYAGGDADINGVGPRRGRVILNGITFLTDPG